MSETLEDAVVSSGKGDSTSPKRILAAIVPHGLEAGAKSPNRSFRLTPWLNDHGSGRFADCHVSARSDARHQRSSARSSESFAATQASVPAITSFFQNGARDLR